MWELLQILSVHALSEKDEKVGTPILSKKSFD